MARELLVSTGRRSSVRAAEMFHAPAAPPIGSGWEGAALVMIAVLMFSFGLVMVYSASAVMAQTAGLPDYYYVERQLIAGGIGLALMIVLSFVDYRRLRLLAWPMLFTTIALLVIVIMPGLHAFTHSANGGRRWIRVGPMLIQPAEFAKISIVIW